MKNGTLYGICFEEPTPYAGTVGYSESTVYVYYNNLISEQYHILFNGGLSTVLYGYYILDENRNVVRSIAIIDEDIDAEIPTFEVMVLDDHIDFDQYMTAYSLRSAGWSETLVATYAYDANGNRTSLTYANGTTTTYAYNQANLVTSVLNKKGSTTLSSHSYTYYLDGNIASETENGTTKTYEYDGLGRLTKETKNGTITSYTYDLNGNRATMTQNGVTTTYTYDDNNRLESETVSGVAKTYSYDNNGNLINAWNAGNPVGAYAYNLFGNQISYTPDGVLYTYYTYRPDGLRHSIGDKVHVWDGANIVADVDGNEVVVYIRGINLIYADDGDKIYYHFNAHGDVVVLTNESGTKTKSYSYNAFGVEYNEATLDNNPFRYCGEYYDKETKTIYLRARYYNAEQGRFTQEDPIRDGYNWYAYCENNPIMFVDPSGLDSWVFYDAESFVKQAQTESEILQYTYGTEVHLFGVNSLDDFLFAWCFMTIYDDSIDGVSMLFHGTPYTLYLGQNEDGTYDQLTSSINNITPNGSYGYYVGNLPKVSMKSINLMSCNGGHLDLIYSNENMQHYGFYHNIAVEFLVTQDVSVVYGMDGNLSYNNFFGNYYPRLSWNQSSYKSWTPTRKFFGKRSPAGKIAFYLKQDGSVGYFGMWNIY